MKQNKDTVWICVAWISLAAICWALAWCVVRTNESDDRRSMEFFKKEKKIEK